jgi:hypothetical protein
VEAGADDALGQGMATALDRVGKIAALNMAELDVEAVPHRRLVELARYGMTAKAPTIKRHRYHRKLATLLATVRWLEAKATDDALELFDVLMTNELMGRALRESNKDKLRRYPAMARDAARCARAVEILLEVLEWGEDTKIELVWDAIENTVTHAELRAAVGRLTEVVPPPEG